MINNQGNIQTISYDHSINARNKHHLHITNANFSHFLETAFYVDITIFTVYHLVSHVCMYVRMYVCVLCVYIHM